jgi:hypothetical protein
MTITPNRQSLKDLANFNVDAQFFQQYGANVFNYRGVDDEQYIEACLKFREVIGDVSEHIRRISNCLPSIVDG